jgi:hypothetical protein
MKKVYIDAILKKKDESNPGPGHYEQKGTVSAANSTKYSMRVRHADLDSKRAKGLPGPGYYNDSSLTGVAPVNSKMASTFQYRFPREERFRVRLSQSPPPGNYDTKQNLNQNFNSVYKYMGSTRFGREPQNTLEQRWLLEKEKKQPGPGAYRTFSEFGGIH